MRRTQVVLAGLFLLLSGTLSCAGGQSKRAATHDPSGVPAGSTAADGDSLSKAGQPPCTQQAWRAVLASAYDEDGPGATVIVSRGGEVLYHDAIGLASIELGVPLQTDHVLRIGSLTKQYTAAAILALAHDEKLSLEDPISRFLPEFPQGHVTVHQLLNHTSGIRSYTDIPGYLVDERIRRDLSTEQLIGVFSEAQPLFEPGQRYAYNNSGYVLLGGIIESITGQEWNAFIRERLLEPVGILRTDYFSDSALVLGRATGYRGGETTAAAGWISMTQPHAAGALSSTVADVDRWQRALHGGELLPESILVEQMTTSDEVTQSPLNESGYGYGLVLGQLLGRRMFHHGGGINGFNSYALWLPDEAMSVVVLANATGSRVPPGVVALRLAAIALGEPFPLEMPAVALAPEELAAIVGTYRVNDRTTRALFLNDGELISQRQGAPEIDVIVVAPDKVVFPNSFLYFTFERDENGAVIAALLHDESGRTVERADKISDSVDRAQPIDLCPEAMARLVGSYELRPGFVLEIRVEDGRLVGQATGQGPLTLEAHAPHRLAAPAFGIGLSFDLPETDGPATALTLHQGGRDTPAKRLE